MREKPYFTARVYLLCTLIVAIALGCRALLPESGLIPDQPITTVAPEDVIPTNAPIPTEAGQPENSKVEITSEQNLYQVTGSTEKELRRQLDTLGPPDEESGKRFDARTDWVIKWYFYYNEGGADCKIDRAEVSLSLTYTYPEWNPPANASKALVQKWNNYLKKLAIHEDVHGDLAKSGAETIYDTIMSMPPSSTCDTLGDATNAAAQEKIDELKQQQADYDSQTNHGETQGAIFP